MIGLARGRSADANARETGHSPRFGEGTDTRTSEPAQRDAGSTRSKWGGKTCWASLLWERYLAFLYHSWLVKVHLHQHTSRLSTQACSSEPGFSPSTRNAYVRAAQCPTWSRRVHRPTSRRHSNRSFSLVRPPHLPAAHSVHGTRRFYVPSEQWLMRNNTGDFLRHPVDIASVLWQVACK